MGMCVNCMPYFPELAVIAYSLLLSAPMKLIMVVYVSSCLLFNLLSLMYQAKFEKCRAYVRRSAGGGQVVFLVFHIVYIVWLVYSLALGTQPCVIANFCVFLVYTI